MKARPPITPPTMGPTFDFGFGPGVDAAPLVVDEPKADPVGVLDPELDKEVVMLEEVVVVEVNLVDVDEEEVAAPPCLVKPKLPIIPSVETPPRLTPKPELLQHVLV
jgi:hypothetical protein